VFSVGVVISGVGTKGAGSVDDASGIVQVAFVVIAEGAVGVGAERVGSICVDVIIVEIQGRRGAGDIQGVGLSVIGVEGVL